MIATRAMTAGCGHIPSLVGALRPGGFFISDDIGDNIAFRDFSTLVACDSIVVKQGSRYIGVMIKPLAAQSESQKDRTEWSSLERDAVNERMETIKTDAIQIVTRMREDIKQSTRLELDDIIYIFRGLIRRSRRVE